MHFPLREGTEVLLAFLNGNPDRPVIVAALPNTEAPSMVGAKNAAQHIIGTPAGNSLVLADAEPDGEDAPAIRLYSPTDESSLNLGKSDEGDVEDGFHLKTKKHGEIHAGTSMLIEVPGHYKMEAGNGGGVVSEDEEEGVVVENFAGLKVESVVGGTISHLMGGKVEMTEALAFESMFGAKLEVKAAASKEVDLVEKKVVADAADHTNVITRWLSTRWDGTIAVKTEDVGEMTISALGSYRLYCPDIRLEAALSFIEAIPTAVTVGGPSAALSGTTNCVVESDVRTMITGSTSSLELVTGGAVLSGTTTFIEGITSLDLSSNGAATVNGAVIMVG